MGYNTTNHETGQYTRLVTSFIFYGFIFWAVWARRKQHGSLNFSDGFATGCLTSLIYGFLVSIWFAIYAELINKQYQPTLIAFERSKLEAAHASPEAITAKIKEVQMSSGGSVLSYLLLFVFMSLFGCVVAALAAAILKTKKTN